MLEIFSLSVHRRYQIFPMVQIPTLVIVVWLSVHPLGFVAPLYLAVYIIGKHINKHVRAHGKKFCTKRGRRIVRHDWNLLLRDDTTCIKFV